MLFNCCPDSHSHSRSDEGNMAACNSTYQRSSQHKTFLIYLTQISGCLFSFLPSLLTSNLLTPSPIQYTHTRTLTHTHTRAHRETLAKCWWRQLNFQQALDYAQLSKNSERGATRQCGWVVYLDDLVVGCFFWLLLCEIKLTKYAHE